MRAILSEAMSDVPAFTSERANIDTERSVKRVYWSIADLLARSEAKSHLETFMRRILSSSVAMARTAFGLPVPAYWELIYI